MISKDEFNQPPQQYKPEGLPVSMYQKAKDVWDNRIGTARAQAYNWRLAFFCTLGLSFLLVIGIIYQSTKSSVVPYIVEVGPGGEVLSTTKAMQVNRAPNEAEIKYFLVEWIKDVRAMPLDIVIKKQSWIRAYGRMRQKAAIKMNDIVSKDDPMKKVGEETISVIPAAIVRMSDKTYQVRWTEDIYTKEGAPKESYRMTGLISIDFSQPKKETEIMSNPIGLYITDFSWSKEL